ncbi:MAG: SPOR domain-containing protein [Rhodomicrobium sp.]
MLQDLVNRPWQALVQFLRGSRPLPEGIFVEPKPGAGKPSLTVAIGKRPKGNALAEYRRRFAASAGQEDPPVAPSPAGGQPAQPDRDYATPRDATAKPRLRAKTRRRHSHSGSGHIFGAAWTLLRLAVLRFQYGVAEIKPTRSVLIGAALACATGLFGAYLYRTVSADRGGALRAIPAAQPLDEKPETANNKLFYDRLGSDAQQETAAASPGVPAATAGLAEPPSAVPVNPADGPVPESKQAAETPAPSKPAVAEPQPSAGPTVAGGETFLPDGVRTGIAKTAPVPAIAPAAGAVPRTNSTPPLQVTESLSASEDGYFVQVRSDQDEKSAEAERAVVMEKYKAVLGDVPMITRSADLKEKGIWFRVLAGPVKSRDEADSLCKKLKSAGLQACIVQKFD